MEYYCVLWIPTTIHRKPEVLPNAEEKFEINISDIKDVPHGITVKLDDKENIIITSQKPDNHHVVLEKIDCSSNGLILYKYEIDKSSENKPLIGEDFPFAIYHCVKRFYHEHEYHEGEEDAHIKPFTSKSKPEIKSPNNEALISYLKNYEEKFSAYLNQVKQAHDVLSKKREKKSYKFYMKTESYKMIKDFCFEVRGHESYYNSLAKSKYNTLCKSGVSDEKKENNDDLSKIAFNIENSLSMIKNIEYKIIEDFSFESFQSSINIAWIALGISVILGIISMVF